MLQFLGCNKHSRNINVTDMILIPGGEFTMGTDSVEASYIVNRYPTYCDISWFYDQMPKHKVKIDSFYLDKYEVTFGEFTDFIRQTGYKSQGNWEQFFTTLSDTMKMKEILSGNDYRNYLENIRQLNKLPIVGVTWEDALQYCTWKGKRLPTEAEWEYVAKWGEKNLIYPWGMQYDSTKANVQNEVGPRPVGSYSPNNYGIHDLGGNVQEWCADYYDQNYYQLKEYDNPTGPKTGKQRVIRGGSWSTNGPFYARSSTRMKIKMGDNYVNLVGFRCACSLDHLKSK